MLIGRYAAKPHPLVGKAGGRGLVYGRMVSRLVTSDDRRES